MPILTGIILILLAAVVALILWTRSLARRAESIVPQAGRLVPVEGGAIHYVESGALQAPTVVLIHGISAQLQHFTYGVAPRLAEDFRVIALDRPGCGYSVRDNDADAALNAQARMIGAFLDKIGVEKAVIAGHSLGGAVSLALALERPDKVAALALISPATAWQDEVHPIFKGLEIRSSLLRRILAHTIAIPLAKLTAKKVLTFAFAPEAVVPGFMDRAAAALGLRPKAFITASSELVALEAGMPAQIARYSDLQVRGAVLFGDADPLLGAELHGRPMTEHGLAYEELPGRGHMLPLTAPQECADFIRRVAATE